MLFKRKVYTVQAASFHLKANPLAIIWFDPIMVTTSWITGKLLYYFFTVEIISKTERDSKVHTTYSYFYS